MKIDKNKVVELVYTLTVDGELTDKTTEDRPLDFIFGTGSLLPKFEEHIAGKEPGESFAFVLSPGEGYGEYDENKISDIPKNCFEIDGKIQDGLLVVGKIIPMMDNMGHILPGKVTAIGDSHVTMDFNHALAGKELNFEGRILTVREATGEELTDGLHGELKRSSCSGSCSSCGGGCH